MVSRASGDSGLSPTFVVVVRWGRFRALSGALLRAGAFVGAFLNNANTFPAFVLAWGVLRAVVVLVGFVLDGFRGFLGFGAPEQAALRFAVVMRLRSVLATQLGAFRPIVVGFVFVVCLADTCGWWLPDHGLVGRGCACKGVGSTDLWARALEAYVHL